MTPDQRRLHLNQDHIIPTHALTDHQIVDIHDDDHLRYQGHFDHDHEDDK